MSTTRRAVRTVREGSPEMTAREFIEMFCKLNDCEPDETVTRIEFERLT